MLWTIFLIATITTEEAAIIPKTWTSRAGWNNGSRHPHPSLCGRSGGGRIG